MIRRLWFCLCVLLLAGTCAADGVSTAKNLTCPDAKVLGKGLIQNVCWSGFFPIRVAGANIIKWGGGKAPPGANPRPMCICGGDLKTGKLPMVGLSAGFWAPQFLVENTRKPFCFPTLGPARRGVGSGISAVFGGRTSGGHVSANGDSSKQSAGFYNTHVFAFPLMDMLKIAQLPNCRSGGRSDIGLMVAYEAFPTWYREQMAILTNPEIFLFANPAALLAGIPDGFAASLDGPIKEIFWMAGFWGPMYSLTGDVVSNVSPVRSTSLTSTRALFQMARIGMLHETVGMNAACTPQLMPIMNKQQFRMQMFYPVAETAGQTNLAGSAPPGPPTAPTGGVTPQQPGATDPASVPEVDPTRLTNRKQCTHNIGESTLLWGDWRTIPVTGEDFLYLVWQWQDCCLGILGG